MRVTAILTQTEQKRQDRSVHRAEKMATQGQNDVSLRSDLPTFGSLGPCKCRPEPKTLDQSVKLGNPHLTR
jgi:hypothetical protein